MSRPKRLVRIIPVLFFLYLINFLDRVNISYAIDAGMFQYLGVPAKQVGVIASIASSLFFVGYFIPQIFSNLGINKQVWYKEDLCSSLHCLGDNNYLNWFRN